ncbi:MAG: UDP-N-acetylglucosamine pyrophosphorylase [Clostridium sp.]|uniref:UDP-N-acetylglucosamine pyrophosphorylase n=1 Tax=Clostridium sp. TaxID=1506 RepID=UPI00306DDFB9
MKYELTVYELGKLLKSVSEEYKMNLVSKMKLSGGWITMIGEVEVDYIPAKPVLSKGNNIVGLKVKNDCGQGNDIKITGIKDCKFAVDIAPRRVKEIHVGGLNLTTVKEKHDECTLNIDENVIFNINAPVEEVIKFL